MIYRQTGKKRHMCINSGVARVLDHLSCEGACASMKAYHKGHIHTTYIVSFQEKNRIRRYVVQRINTHVFRQPEAVMGNIMTVTSHMRRKITEGGGDPFRETLTIIPWSDGRPFYRDDTGSWYRAYLYVEGTRSYDVIRNRDRAREAARSFGRFQSMLSDLPPGLIHETIADFHHTPTRFWSFLHACRDDPNNRAHKAKKEIDFVMERKGDTGVLSALKEKGVLPVRITHNDTKINNVLFDEKTGKAVCVIDLDTVMPGLSLYDFGDCVRTAATPAAEDERDLSKVYCDLELFRSLAEGYMEEMGDIISAAERQYLAFSAKLMTLESGIRFLTDYLCGDVYFRTRLIHHNLYRAQNQFQLVSDMEQKMGQMEVIVESINGVR
jgi:hypothetical protein